ncbi:MAG: patatin-like phospholipase family protein [Hylemonella sp.]|nr:patatin-like phospholipase family protein [Hylemonella sp.]MDH5709155.1 patatin-like phospholipase family protein [Hylemonella sp.]
MEKPSHSRPVTGLLLSGGGARAAYQVGVLKALARLRRAHEPRRRSSPFDIITGTSAGAINAAALACGADDFDLAVRRIAAVWENFETSQVYASDLFSVLRSGARWMGLLSLGWMIARWRRIKPRSLLDNAPLEQLLHELVPLERLPGLIAQGHLQALGVTASSYSSGHHVTFFQGADHLTPWVRSQRLAVREQIGYAHLLASSAIPFVFPAQELALHGGSEYFGDGSMRQTAPVAPVIHLGAERILVIGSGRMHEPRDKPIAQPQTSYPSLAQIAGHAMSSIFLDAMAVDIERIRRINQTLSLVPPEARQASALRPVELLLISPSRRLDQIAASHAKALPPMVRNLLGSLGVSSSAADVKGGALTSYLLFEAAYTRELVALGQADTLRQTAEICRFFGWSGDPGETAPVHEERRRDPLRV